MGSTACGKRFNKRHLETLRPDETDEKERKRMTTIPDFKAPGLITSEDLVGSRAVVTAVGEVDLSSAAELERAIEAARERGASEIWLDFTCTTFMDCAGLCTLLEARARLIEEARRLVLICPPGPVLRLLTLTGADGVLEIHPTRSAQ